MSQVIFSTNGTGWWSKTKANITITDMTVTESCWDYQVGVVDFPEFGELRVYFDTKTWDVDDYGLIYTDNRFLKELRAFLNMHGLPGSDVDYSEQGMQGDDYVSLDVGKKFMKAWSKKFNIQWDKPLPFKNGMEYMTQ